MPKTRVQRWSTACSLRRYRYQPAANIFFSLSTNSLLFLNQDNANNTNWNRPLCGIVLVSLFAGRKPDMGHSPIFNRRKRFRFSGRLIILDSRQKHRQIFFGTGTMPHFHIDYRIGSPNIAGGKIPNRSL